MGSNYNIGDRYVFYPKRNELVDLHNDCDVVVLGANECRLLKYLVKNNERALPRNELIEVLWNEREIFVDGSSLTQSISILRRALSDPVKTPTYIKTVPKFGYEFIAPVQASKPTVYIESGMEDDSGNLIGDIKEARGILLPNFYLFSSMFRRVTIALIFQSLITVYQEEIINIIRSL